MGETKKTVKAPQDHKVKDEKPKVDTVEITVGAEGAERAIPASRIAIRGIVATVPDEALDDFEFLDDLRAMQDQQDASRLPALLRRLVVADDYRRRRNSGDFGASIPLTPSQDDHCLRSSVRETRSGSDALIANEEGTVCGV